MAKFCLLTAASHIGAPICLGYIESFQAHDPHRVGNVSVELQGRIEECRALMYRQDLKAKDIEQYRSRMLPTHQVSFFNCYPTLGSRSQQKIKNLCFTN